MKGREPFFEAMDTLEARGINVVAAAYWLDSELEAVGVRAERLKAWRTVFYDPWPDARTRATLAWSRQKGRAFNVSLHIVHARNGW